MNLKEYLSRMPWVPVVVVSNNLYTGKTFSQISKNIWQMVIFNKFCLDHSTARKYWYLIEYFHISK